MSSPTAIDEIEHHLPDDIAGATKLLRSLLFQEAQSERDGSFGDALAILAKTSSQHRNLVPIIIRFLAIPNVIPAPNATNQIARNVVDLAINSLPDLCSFLGLTTGAQTFQNFAILKGTHERICSLLSPMKREKSSLEIFLSARHPIVQCLHHSAVEAYCAPFGLATTTNRVEHIFSLVRKISTSDHATLNHQIKVFRTTVNDYSNQSTGRHNFLTTEYFLPFVEAANLSVENFLTETRGRYAVTISTILAQDNAIQKHYPLQEEREFTILIPLRNSGPGTALNVQAELVHNEEQIIIGSAKTNLGAIPPGDFSAAFDALVIKNSQVVNTIFTISWEEMGSLERKSLAQEVVIHSQKTDVPWHSLKYAQPYSTGVAKGSDFVGRREKVVSLANNILRTPMEPFFVTGQKRVGKTSLALAAADFARTQSPDLTYTYVLWGGIAYENPRDSINALGKKIVDLVERSLPKRPNTEKVASMGLWLPRYLSSGTPTN